MSSVQVTKCRNLKASKNDRRGAVWCSQCQHHCITDNDNKCQCCLTELATNKRKYTELKKFDRILEECGGIIEEYMANPCRRDFEFAWSIRIGIINYWVPAKVIAEYKELPTLECPDKYQKFLEAVKKECIVLPRYMHSIK